MKIINNNGSGSSGSSSDSVKAGDVVLSASSKLIDDNGNQIIPAKYFDLSTDDYFASLEDTDIRSTNIFFPTPQFAAFPKAKTYSNVSDEKIYNISESKYLSGGIINGNYAISVIDKLNNSGQTYEIPVSDVNFNECIYDYKNTVYIYKNSYLSQKTDFINSIIKVDLTTGEYETITINNKRIVNSFYDRTNEKFITIEYNQTGIGDLDQTKSGVFISDDFENTGIVATHKITDFTTDVLTSIDICRKYSILTQDQNVLLFDPILKQLNKKTNTTSVLNIDILDENGEKTLIGDCNMVIEQYGNYFVCFEHFTDETKTSRFVAWVAKNQTTNEVVYCFAKNLTTANNFGVIFDNVFNYDFEAETYFGLALLYQNSLTDKRQVLCFKNQHLYDDVSTFNDGPIGTLFNKNYFKNINYSEVYSNKEMLVIDNFGTLVKYESSDGNISVVKFDGASLGGVFVNKLAQANDSLKYFLKIRN